MGPTWGIDIRENRIEGLVLEDASAPKKLRRMRVPAEFENGYYHVLGQVHKLVEVLSSEVGVRPEKIGVASLGTIDPITKTIKNSAATVFANKPLLTDLETYLGVPIKLENVGNTLALSETRFGAVTEILPAAKCVVALMLDDTVEGGIILNGRILKGRQGIAGSWGHNYLDDSGGSCSCGRRGCVETVLSRGALESFYTEATGRHLSIEKIAEIASTHQDDAAAATVERLVYNFAKAVGPIINILDPDCLIVGGAIGQIDALYEQGPDLIKRFVHNSRLDTVMLRPKLGISASVYGAAIL